MLYSKQFHQATTYLTENKANFLQPLNKKISFLLAKVVVFSRYSEQSILFSPFSKPQKAYGHDYIPA
jgi:hypothetical protein